MQFCGQSLSSERPLTATPRAIIDDAVEQKTVVIQIQPEGEEAQEGNSGILMMHLVEALRLASQLIDAILQVELHY